MELRVLGWLTLLFIPKDNLNPTYSWNIRTLGRSRHV